MHRVRHHHGGPGSAPFRQVRRYYEPGFSHQAAIVVAGSNCNLLLNTQPKRGPVIEYAPHSKWSPRYPRRHFLSGTGCRSPLTRRVALIGMKDRVLRTEAAAVEVKENVNASLDEPNLGLSGPNIRDVESSERRGIPETVQFYGDIRHRDA